MSLKVDSWKCEQRNDKNKVESTKREKERENIQRLERGGEEWQSPTEEIPPQIPVNDVINGEMCEEERDQNRHETHMDVNHEREERDDGKVPLSVFSSRDLRVFKKERHSERQ